MIDLNVDMRLPAWMEQAVCTWQDGDAWFPQNGVMPNRAKRVCEQLCPVKDECLEFALTERMPWGVWGGKSRKQREKILKERGVTLPDESEAA